MQRISEHKIPSSSWYIYKSCSPSKSQGTSQKKVEEDCKSQEPLPLLEETSSTRSICEISTIWLLKQAPHYDNTSQHINVDEEISQGTIPGLKTTGNQCLQRRRIHFSQKKAPITNDQHWPHIYTSGLRRFHVGGWRFQKSLCIQVRLGRGWMKEGWKLCKYSVLTNLWHSQKMSFPKDRFLLYHRSLPETHYVDQASLKPTDIHLPLPFDFCD